MLKFGQRCDGCPLRPRCTTGPDERHGVGKARYHRARKVLLQLRLTAAMVNAKRLFTLETSAPATA